MTAVASVVCVSARSTGHEDVTQHVLRMAVSASRLCSSRPTHRHTSAADQCKIPVKVASAPWARGLMLNNLLSALIWPDKGRDSLTTREDKVFLSIASQRFSYNVVASHHFWNLVGTSCPNAFLLFQPRHSRQSGPQAV